MIAIGTGSILEILPFSVSSFQSFTFFEKSKCKLDKCFRIIEVEPSLLSFELGSFSHFLSNKSFTGSGIFLICFFKLSKSLSIFLMQILCHHYY